MLWIVVLLMCFLPTVESEDCKKSEIIVGRLGDELVLNFTFSDLKDEHTKYIAQFNKDIHPNEEKDATQKNTTIQEIKEKSQIWFKNEPDSNQDFILDGYQNDYEGSQTAIFTTNDAFVVKKRKLQKEDTGIYWIDFSMIDLGWKALIITGKPTIKGRTSPNPVLKQEDNYKTILQLECNSISTSIGPCQLVYNSMYILWYKNGMRMTDLDPTLSQINVTVDENGGSFTCVATEYPPCYHRLQTTKHYNVLNIEECNNVFEKETFTVNPQYGPIDVKLQPDQGEITIKLQPDKREITVNQGEDLKVRCTAKCRPKCDLKWRKYLDYSKLVSLEERTIGNDLKIENISSFDEGIYSCLVNNDHGVAEKNFTLRIRDLMNKTPKSAVLNNVLVAVKIVIYVVIIVAVVAVAVIVVVILFAKYRKVKGKRSEVAQESPAEEDEAMVSPQRELLPTDSRLIIDDRIYETIDGSNETLNRSNGTLNGSNGTLNRSNGTLNGSNGTLNRSNATLYGSYATLNRSNVTLDRSYETIEAPFAGTSGEKDSKKDGQNQKSKYHKYDVLGFRIPRLYSRLRPTMSKK